MCIGVFIAASAVVSPPFDCIESKGCRDAGAIEFLAQCGQIPRHDRHDIGVDHRGRSALVLFDLRQDLEADAAGQIRRPTRDDRFDHLLVSGIGKRVQQADGDGLDPFGEQRVHRPFSVRRVERSLDLTPDIHPFIDHDAQIALDQRRRLLPGDVVEARHAQVADFQDIAEALRGDEPGSGALQLQNGIGGHRGGMQDLFDVRPAEANILEHLADAVDDGSRIVVDAGGDFLGMNGAVVAQKDDVGERAADVHADAKTWHVETPLQWFIPYDKGPKEMLGGLARGACGHSDACGGA